MLGRFHAPGIGRVGSTPLASGKMAGDRFRHVGHRLHEDLQTTHVEGDTPEFHVSSETLYERVARARARWLRRVMYGSVATSTEKCFAYAVFEHLNCVTLDAWPGQLRLTELLGFKSAKTIQRAAGSLEDLAVLAVVRSRNNYRYAPVFLPGDEDKIVPANGQDGAARADTTALGPAIPKFAALILFNLIGQPLTWDG
jgi:hypothetical protein